MFSLSEKQEPTYFNPSVYEAAKKGELSKIQEFIAKNGWVDMPNGKGNSMLFYASKKGQVEVANFLLKKGAHLYPNKKGKDIVNIATQEVKYLLETKNVKEEKIENLIKRKISEFISIKEGFYFIASLQDDKLRIEGFQQFAVHLAFYSFKDALSFFNLIENIVQPEIIEYIVHPFLCCGDIDAAKKFIDQIQISNETLTSLSRRIEIYSELLCKLETVAEKNQSQFIKSIKIGFEFQNKSMQLSALDLEIIVTAMSEYRSYTDALKYANKLEGPFKFFARKGLCYSGLEKLAIIARDKVKAEEEDKVQFETLRRELYKLMDE